MNNTKRLSNIDRIIFGILIGVSFFTLHSEAAVWMFVILASYFVSSMLHTPGFFPKGDGEDDERTE